MSEVVESSDEFPHSVTGDAENVTTENGSKPRRRTPEERASIARAKAERQAARAARKAEREQAAAARKTKLEAATAGARHVAAAFERRADRLARIQAAPETATRRKQVRKMLRAAADADAHNNREMARVAAANATAEEKVEIRDRGTGLTRLKLAASPIGLLIEQKKIGPEERNAADEIARAIHLIAGRLGVKGGLNIDRVDCSPRGDAPGAPLKAVVRYQAWATHWSRRKALFCDPMLEIIVAVVIDERSIRATARDVERSHVAVERGVIAGLRDYAARANLVTGSMALRWIQEAEAVFVTPALMLRKAVNRARYER